MENHGLINYIDTKAKCRHRKKLTCVKVLCGRCLSEFVDWRYSQSCWYFRPNSVNCCSSHLLSGSTLPSPPLPCVKVQYIQTVFGWERVGGVEFLWRPYSAGVWHSVSDHIQNLLNCQTAPNKNLGGEGTSDRWTPDAKSLYRSILLDDDILLWCLYS